MPGTGFRLSTPIALLTAAFLETSCILDQEQSVSGSTARTAKTAYLGDWGGHFSLPDNSGSDSLHFAIRWSLQNGAYSYALDLDFEGGLSPISRQSGSWTLAASSANFVPGDCSEFDPDSDRWIPEACMAPFSWSTSPVEGTWSVTWGAIRLYSPYSAKHGIAGSEGFSFLANLNPANATLIKAVDADFEAVTTKAQLESLWDSGTSLAAGAIPVQAGTLFMARSNLGALYLVRADQGTLHCVIFP